MELNFKRGTNLMLLPVRQSPLQVLPLNCTVYHEEVSCYVKGKMGKKPKLGGQGRGRTRTLGVGADIARLASGVRTELRNVLLSLRMWMKTPAHLARACAEPSKHLLVQDQESGQSPG